MKISNLLIISIAALFILTSCKGGKLPGADARKVSYDAKERVKKNLEEGKGFRLDDALKRKKGGDFEFASSNELWRASLDVIDFMPLASANYSGGMIITDWYIDSSNPKESIKITIRFLTNEIRSDSISIKTFYRTCKNINECQISEKKGSLSQELRKEILKLATKYKKETDDKNFQPYIVSDPSN